MHRSVDSIRRHRHFPGFRERRATAMLEFAIAAPALLYFFAAASDYALGWWDKGCLANAVAQAPTTPFAKGRRSVRKI